MYVDGQGLNGGISLSKYATHGAPAGPSSFLAPDIIYPTLDRYSISFGSGAAVASNGNLVLFGTVKGHLALVKLQIADSGSTNPTAANTNFVLPRIGGKYAYFTVQFTQGTTALSPSEVAADGLLMTYDGSTTRGTLVSATGGGNGQPVTATYVVKIAPHGLSRTNKGVYQFTIAPDAIIDSSGDGNVGVVLAAYDVYVPPRNVGTPSYSTVNLLASELPTTFYP
jgi:hypothetical protein